MSLRLLGMSRILYPNWVSISYFTQGWRYFFSQEMYNITVLTATALMIQLSFTGFSLVNLICDVFGIIALRRVLAGGICISEKRLANKTVIITGANIGIGKETARDLLRRGARVILACRSLSKAEDARRELVREGGKVEVRHLDVSSLQSVREFAAGIIKDKIKIHILINNAGIMGCPYKLTDDGFEMTMATNHLGHFLLTNLLLPQLKHDEPARIVNVSSLAHIRGNINFEDFSYKGGYDSAQAYADSKLANVLFTRQLANILKGSNIQVFSLHPGVVQTNIAHHLLSETALNISNYLSGIILKTTSEGAQTTIHCCLEAQQHPEMYFSDCAVGWASSAGKDEVLAEKLWNFSAKLVHLK